MVEVARPVRRFAPVTAGCAGAAGFRRWVWAIIAVAFFCLAGAARAQAATIYTAGPGDATGGCDTLSTPGTCSLRQLIAQSAAGDTIEVPAGDYSLTNGFLDVTHDLTIIGAGARTTTIHDSSDRVFGIIGVNGSQPTVVISGLSITDGVASSGNGGGILNQGDLTLSQDEVQRDNTDLGNGGGVANDGGTLVISQSLISGNHSKNGDGGGDGGGVSNDGPGGTVSIADSTIADNIADVGGGGIADESGTGGTALVYATIAGNQALSGGGLLNASTITAIDSIVANNSAGSGPSDCAGGVVSAGFDLESGTDCGFIAGGDHQNANPLFTSGAPAQDGGPTDTLALAPTSPAVDAIPSTSPGCGGVDQTGTTRPQGTACDIGAYELPQAAPAPPADPTLTVAGATVATAVNTEYSGPVATFSDSAAGTASSAFTATIDWGDGTTTEGTITNFLGEYAVNGIHTYSAGGSYTVVVAVADNLGDSATGDSVADVTSQPQLSAGTPDVQGTSAASLSGTVNPEGQATQAYYQYGLDRRYSQIGASGPDYTASTASQRLTAGFAAQPVVGTLGGLLPNALYHVRLVATNSTGTAYGPDQTFTTKADPAPPPPVLGQSVDLKPVSGLVFIHVPSGRGSNAVASAAAKAPSTSSGFVPLTQARQLPAGTEVDAVQGALALTTATAKRKKSQTGTFSGAVFKLSQQRSGANKGQETLSLVEGAYKGAPSFVSCKARKAFAGPVAGIASLSPSVLQTLHAKDNHGSFRTRGKLAAGTVRGTVWAMSERCDGTYTVVYRGVVDVYVYAIRKTVAVHAGRHYLAMYGKRHP